VFAVVGYSWAPHIALHPIEIEASLIESGAHTLRPLNNTSRLVYKETFIVPHADPLTQGVTSVNVRFLVFVKKPLAAAHSTHSNTEDRSGVEVIFVRHNLQSDSMYSTCWKQHKSMIEDLIDYNLDELAETCSKA
jgi:hypothetical protein